MGDLARPRTAIKINLGNPDLAFKTSYLRNDGVGLARMKFIINEYIRVHPLALLHPEKVDDPEARRTMDRLTYAYSDGGDFFAERTSEGIGTIAAPFWPKPAVVRMSDFKTNGRRPSPGSAVFGDVAHVLVWVLAGVAVIEGVGLVTLWVLLTPAGGSLARAAGKPTNCAVTSTGHSR